MVLVMKIQVDLISYNVGNIINFIVESENGGSVLVKMKYYNLV